MFKFSSYLIVLMLSIHAAQVNAEMPDKDALESAMKECESSLSSSNNGMADPSDMEECMSAKGFTRPSGGRGGPGSEEGGPGNPPPDF
ncbi:MAG: hypothetical protein PVI97_02090 [Candidatus Thiodiazotropha sp.]|jgi:hypothetical protein